MYLFSKSIPINYLSCALILPMEGILTPVCFRNFETDHTTIGTKIVTPITGVDKFITKLFSTGKQDRYTIMPETVPFCAHQDWISHRVEITSRRCDHRRWQLLS